MNLKLAEYKDGKFDRFLELGDFAYMEYCILINPHKVMSEINLPIITWLFCFLDEKDPLNRFDGLFDGRTYGNGTFVLVSEEDHNMVEKKVLFKDLFQEKTKSYDLVLRKINSLAISKGNLHENPELYEKLTTKN